MAIPDSLCNLSPMEIPRPKCNGLQFIRTRGRMGFYRSIRESGSKYGVHIKPNGPRRPVLSQDLYKRPETVKEEDSEVSEGDSGRSQTSSTSSRLSSPAELEPDYPVDDAPAPPRKFPSDPRNHPTTR